MILHLYEGGNKMGNEPEAGHASVITESLAVLQEKRGSVLAVGIILIVLGTAAVALPMAAAMAIEAVLGWVLIFAGIIQVFHAFQAPKEYGMVQSLVIAIVSAAAGLLMLAYPLEGVFSLTLLLTVYFMIQGFFKMALAFQLRPALHWGWVFCGGNLSFILGLLIYAELPSSAAWALGLLVGIDMIFGGWTMVILARNLHQAQSPEAAA